MRYICFAIACMAVAATATASDFAACITEEPMESLTAYLLPLTVTETGGAVVYIAIEPISPESMEIQVTSAAGEVLGSIPDVDPKKGSQKFLVELGRTVSPEEELVAKAITSDRVQEAPVRDAIGESSCRIFLIAGFHYDPVWWNTQSNYLAAGGGMKPERDGAFGLIETYLKACREDADYKFVLEQVPYLKPYWDAFPGERAFIEQLIADGRLQVLGGMYCEAQTNLIGPESYAQNFLYGCRYMESVYNSPQSTAWQCDCFGHDPNFAQFCDDAGLTWASYARAAFHHFGVGTEEQNIPSEHRWLGPDGSEILTHYMSGHYDFYYKRLKDRTPDEFNAHLIDAMLNLGQSSATGNICLPLLGDFAPALPELAERCRAFNERYDGIDASVATFAEFAQAVEAEVESKNIYLPPIARDLNPVLSGCNLTFEDTKQAARAAENRLLTAETMASSLGIFGAEYPYADFSRAWRQLMFGTHHDAITGSEGGEVYFHLLSSWRVAWAEGGKLIDKCLNALIENVDSSNAPYGAELAVVVFNPHPFNARCTVEAEIVSLPADADYVVVDYEGNELPTECERIGDGGIIKFMPDEMPLIGWKTYWLKRRAVQENIAEVIPGDEATIENERFRITVDASRGGCLSSIYDKKYRRELLKPGGLGAEVVTRGEYPGHTRFPGMGEGPAWLIHTNGKFKSTSDTPVTLNKIANETAATIIAEAPFGAGIRRMIYTLGTGECALDIACEIGGYRGMDELLTLDFDFDIDGAMPFSEVSNFVLGRSTGWWEDVAEHKFPHNFSCNRFCGLGAPLWIDVPVEDRIISRSHSVAEVVYPADMDAGLREPVDNLVKALFGRGISSTALPDDQRAYGDRNLDSNMPDFRIIIGDAKLNKRAGDIGSHPDGDLVFMDGDDGIPILLVNAGDVAEVVRIVGDTIAQVKSDARIRATSSKVHPGMDSDPDWGAAIFNRGNIDFIADGTGRFSVSLYRAIAAEPGFRWMHAPERRLPDGSIAQTEHWSHRYEFRLTSFDGDWRDAGLGDTAAEFNRPPAAVCGAIVDGGLPVEWSMLAKPADGWEMSCLKAPCPPDYSQQIESGAKPGECIIRIYEDRGESSRCKLSFNPEIEAAYESDLIEKNKNEVRDAGNGINTGLGTFEMKTLGMKFKTSDILQDIDLALPIDPPPPHYSPCWYHDRHDPPTGNSPQSLLFRQREIIFDAKNKASVDIDISNSAIDEVFDGAVKIIAPNGITCEPSEIHVSLEPSGFESVHIQLEAASKLDATRWLRAEMTDIHGNVIYDIIPTGETSPDDFPIDIRLVDDTLGVEPGTPFEVSAILKNISRDRIPVHAELICPFEMWNWVDSFEDSPLWLDPGEEREIGFGLTPGADVVPGNYFAFIKVMAGDMSRFSEPVDIWRIDGGAAYLLDGRREILTGEKCIIEVGYITSERLVSDEPSWSMQLPFEGRVEEISREISGGGIGKVRLTLGVTSVNRLEEGEYAAVLKLHAAGGSFEMPVIFKAGLFAEVRMVSGLNIDDDYGAWESSLTPLGLLTQEHMRGIRGYDVDDLGVEPWVGWSAEGLYIACRARDNVLDNPHSGANIWRGDCLQVAFRTPNFTGSGSLLQTAAEYSFALTSSGLASWCNHNRIGEPRMEPPGGTVDFPLRVERIMQETFYRVFIPAEAFGIDALHAGDIIRFNLAMNDSDGMGWKGAAEWARGTVLVKDPDAFGAIRLTD